MGIHGTKRLNVEAKFRRFAEWASHQAGRAYFFAGCVALIVVWVPTLWLLPFNVSQLLVNTATTIITFLLVALLQNSQNRNDKAIQTKLDAVIAVLETSNRLQRAEQLSESEIDALHDEVADG